MRRVLSARLSRACTVLLPIVLAGLLWPHVGTAQSVFPNTNGQALAGVTSFVAFGYTNGWLFVEADKELFQDSLDRAFKLGLRRDGVTVAMSPNYLACEVNAVQSGASVASFWSVRYYEASTAGVHRLMWEVAGIGTVRRENFDAEDIGQRCVDAFALEWLKWNPRRTP